MITASSNQSTMPNELEFNELPIGVNKAVNIKDQKLFNGLSFPLILSPLEVFKNKDTQFWNDWVKENLKTIESLLLKYGAILFRGLPLDTDKDFNEFPRAYGYQEFPYRGGSAQRRHILGNVYTSNQAPPEIIIPMHHELAYVNDYPHILFFYCDLPAKEKGDTPIALSNVIYLKMAARQPDFVKRLEKEKLRYVRIARHEEMLVLGLEGAGNQLPLLIIRRKP